MPFNWSSLVVRLVTALPSIIAHVQETKAGMPGADKKALVKKAAADFIGDAESITGKELVNHPAVDALIDATVSAVKQGTELVNSIKHQPGQQSSGPVK